MALPQGLWTRVSNQFPGIPEFMEIDTGRRRIISVLVMTVEPLRYTSLSCWYEDIEPGLIETWIRFRGNRQECVYRTEEEVIYWKLRDQEHPWVWTPIAETPSWLPEWLEKQHERMDLKETDGKITP